MSQEYQRLVRNPDQPSPCRLRPFNPRPPRTTPRQGEHPAEEPAGVAATGKAVANLNIACNPRRFDATQGTWIDGTAVFWQCEVWGSLGENAVEYLHKGDRVLVTGRVKAYTWTPTEGPNAGTEQRRMQIVVDEIGPSLRFVTTKLDKASDGTSETPAAEDSPF